jgi:NAD+ kinase
VGFVRVALVGKYQARGSRAALEDIAHYLMDAGCEVVIEQDTALNTGMVQHHTVMDFAQMGASCDLALVLGGDGTMLGVGRHLAKFGVPVIGINQGRLGFMTDIPFENYASVLGPMLRGRYEEDPRDIIQASVWRDDHRIFSAIAINDVVVNRTSAGMVELDIEVGGHFVARHRADGLIVSTPTGSTAYALSAGGPLLHPGIDGWVMVSIAPHSLSNRPVVLPCDQEITIRVVGGREISANFDMQTFTSLMHGDRITVSRSQHRLRLLHPLGWSHFDTLRDKLHWNEGSY